MRAAILSLALACALASAVVARDGEAALSGRVDLRGPWHMQCAALEEGGGDTLSRPGAATRGWYPVQVPTTVLGALVKNGVYPDPRIGLNAYRIPDSSDEFNRAHDLAKYSHLPDKRNPWREPYWFRTEFALDSVSHTKRLWLHFDAINYRADLWVNGTQVAERQTMAGMFQRFQFDITACIHSGKNALAVKIYPVDHPGLPQTQLQVLGPDRGYQSDLMYDVTEIVTIGYDCMMTVPDRNMGLWQPVWLEWTGPVAMRDPFIITDLPLPDTNRAILKISVELQNVTRAPVSGCLQGSIAGTELRFAQRVELGPQETKTVTLLPEPMLRQPRLWWPHGYGEQFLYELVLQMDVGGTISSEKRVHFGVRELGYEMHERNGYYGRRVLVNGQKILCSGGYIQPELMFDWDARRMEREIRYYAEANLNLIYFEDIPNPPEPFLDLCDRYGLLFGECFYSCYWLRPGKPYPADFPLLERCTVDLLKRYRNHPSLLFYMAMNEEDTKEEVYTMWRRHVLELDGTRWFIPSAYFPSDRKEMGAWFKKELPTGMTDKGASYSWAEPAQYFNWVREGRNWTFMMESGSASLPPISSLARFLTNAPAVSRAEKLFPLDAMWAHHGANRYYRGYDDALRRLLGEPHSVADYCWKGHLLTADQHRSMFEAVNHRMWDITSGFTQWKINSCEPSIQWQLFDWYLKPMVSWYYIKKACEPLHVQLNLPDSRVSIVNRQLSPQPGLEVRAREFDLNGQLLWEKSGKAGAPANGYSELFNVPSPESAGPVYFVKLDLKNRRGGVVAHNFYWLRSKGTTDYRALQSLPLVRLKSELKMARESAENVARVRVSNPTRHIAFFVQLALTKGPQGEEILPVLWDDNYFSLLPGEEREVKARLAASGAGRERISLEVGGWNIATAFECLALSVSPQTPAPGQECTVTAAIADTFLDGSRVDLFLDGESCSSRRVWARGAATQTFSFPLTLEQGGEHRISVGGCELRVRVPQRR